MGSIYSLNCTTRQKHCKTKVSGQSCFSGGRSCFWVCHLDLEGPGPQVCPNIPSVVHVSTNETLVDGYNWESTPFHVLLMSLLSWPPPVELLVSDLLLPPLALGSIVFFIGRAFPKKQRACNTKMVSFNESFVNSPQMWCDACTNLIKKRISSINKVKNDATSMSVIWSSLNSAWMTPLLTWSSLLNG